MTSTETAKADPWENTNRKVFRFNTEVDRIVLSPIADGYRAAVPRAARNGIRNAYDNLQEPTNLANAVAQGKIKSAFRALDRILINGVLGLGVADHATDMGLTEQPPRFAKNFMPGADGIEAAVRAYVEAVKAGRFPDPEHQF